MAKFKTNPKDYLKVEKDDSRITLMKTQKFESFNEDILGLGKIENKSTQIDGLSVMFDLEGFTTFCR